MMDNKLISDLSWNNIAKKKSAKWGFMGSNTFRDAMERGVFEVGTVTEPADTTAYTIGVDLGIPRDTLYGRPITEAAVNEFLLRHRTYDEFRARYLGNWVDTRPPHIDLAQAQNDRIRGMTMDTVLLEDVNNWGIADPTPPGYWSNLQV